MTRKRVPPFVTYCHDCERDNVGVVRDVGLNVDKPRWRVALHHVVYRDSSSPICTGSRVIVSDAVVFRNEADQPTKLL